MFNRFVKLFTPGANSPEDLAEVLQKAVKKALVEGRGHTTELEDVVTGYRGLRIATTNAPIERLRPLSLDSVEVPETDPKLVWLRLHRHADVTMETLREGTWLRPVVDVDVALEHVPEGGDVGPFTVVVNADHRTHLNAILGEVFYGLHLAFEHKDSDELKAAIKQLAHGDWS